jgi:hypothetical protein
LLTNLTFDQADTAEVLRRYKGQETVERRYGDFKGPLAVAPMFLHNNRRIEALITVICLALLIFCLVEREIRTQIAPELTMAGIYPQNRAVKPTGRLIFAASPPSDSSPPPQPAHRSSPNPPTPNSASSTCSKSTPESTDNSLPPMCGRPV